MHKTFLSVGALSGAIAVSLGAFGAHGLKQIVSPDTASIFQTGVQYQIYHTLALLLIAVIHDRLPNKWIMWAGYFFSFGILFFSGSLYLITVLKAAERAIPVFVGAITPMGGLFFILGWLCLLVGVFKKA
ncbi:MAG TPA: DUF423 domain-containing protein [Chitinophagaceae bacterium]|jgi:uncharacterized membrane protein YgdD (TMEM256/DUF423 family)|nr:DUF423 domain-containing protein [Chitinophagaceae bacterium]